MKYQLALFLPQKESIYPARKEWFGKLIGVEHEPFIENSYKVSAQWKAEQFAKDLPTPAFGVVNGDDIHIQKMADSLSKYGAFNVSPLPPQKVNSTGKICCCCSFFMKRR